MAPYTQQPAYMKYPPGLASNGRGGNVNGGRDNDGKNRGGKFNNGNTHYSGEGIGRAPYGNQTHAPSGVLGTPYTGGFPPGGYPAGPPTAGPTPGGKYPMSPGNMANSMGTFPPEPPMSDPAVLMGFAPRSSTIGQPMPQRTPYTAYTSSGQNSALQVATSTAPPSGPYTKALPMAQSTGDSLAKPQVNLTDPTSALNALEMGINMHAAAPDFFPTIYAPIPCREGTALTHSSMIAASTPATPVRAAAAENPVVLLQGTIKKADDLANLLSHGMLTLSQTLSAADTEEFLGILKEASKDRRAKQYALEEKRKQTIGKLTQAHRQEVHCEQNIAWFIDFAGRKMSESLDSEDKEALQRKAAECLQAATKHSSAAANYRLKVEAGWKEMHGIDREEVYATTAYVDILSRIVEEGLARAKKSAESEVDDESFKVVDKTLNDTGHTSEGKAKDKTEIPTANLNTTPAKGNAMETAEEIKKDDTAVNTTKKQHGAKNPPNPQATRQPNSKEQTGYRNQEHTGDKNKEQTGDKNKEQTSDKIKEHTGDKNKKRNHGNNKGKKKNTNSTSTVGAAAQQATTNAYIDQDNRKGG